MKQYLILKKHKHRCPAVALYGGIAALAFRDSVPKESWLHCQGELRNGPLISGNNFFTSRSSFQQNFGHLAARWRLPVRSCRNFQQCEFAPDFSQPMLSALAFYAGLTATIFPMLPSQGIGVVVRLDLFLQGSNFGFAILREST